MNKRHLYNLEELTSREAFHYGLISRKQLADKLATERRQRYEARVAAGWQERYPVPALLITTHAERSGLRTGSV